MVLAALEGAAKRDLTTVCDSCLTPGPRSWRVPAPGTDERCSSRMESGMVLTRCTIVSMRMRLFVSGVCIVLTGVVGTPAAPGPAPLTRGDLRWLARVTFGIDTATVARYRALGVGGWDTHVNQGNAQGQLASLLTSLGQGLAGFAEQMGPAWNQTVVFVLSEFGRTFRENGTHDTDHGHGSVHWVLGGAVHGGRIAGEQIAVTAQTLNQNRDFPVLTEYRGLLGGIFKRIYMLDSSRIERVFPNTVPLELGLV
jgi:Protein of unknown function (DUF1501)